MTTDFKILWAAEDWQGVYKNGQLVWEGHSLHYSQLLVFLKPYLKDVSIEEIDYSDKLGHLEAWGGLLPPIWEDIETEINAKGQ